MKIAKSLIAVVGIPVYALILCHPVVTSLAAMLVGDVWWGSSWTVLATLLVVSYGAGLVILGPERKRRCGILVFATVILAGFATLSVPTALSLIGFGVVFAVMRMMIFNRTVADIPSGLTVGAIGFALAVFLVPISLWMAICAFFLVQWLDELKNPEAVQPQVTDRFRDNERLAKRLLSQGF